MAATWRRATLAALLLCSAARGDFELDLGDDTYSGVWTARSGDGRFKLAAAVPGGVYSDLRRAGVLNQSLYYGANDVSYRWVSELDWTFTRHFSVGADMLASAAVQLVCDGVDAVGNVSVNGRLVGSVDNQFVRHAFDVKATLKEGVNSLQVSLRSPSAYAHERYERQARDYIVPPKCPPPVQHGVCHVNHIRKMQASFSWDWGPAFPNVGVWRPIRLVGFDAARLRDVMVDARPAGGAPIGVWTVGARLLLDAAVDVAVNYSVAVAGVDALAEGSFRVGAGTHEVTLDPAETRLLTADDLWWPNGPLGQPTLHQLTLCLTTTEPATQPLPCRNVSVGLRSVELVQEPVDAANASKGLTFFFRVNGVDMFAKGSNWIPADALTERVTTAYLRRLLTSARDANMNMLRVWGGGVYEDDAFYQLADELGLMVWQDAMFACAMYPTDDAFLDSVRREVRAQAWRLQRHPSVVVWAGNNENEIALRDNWYGTAADFARYKADYVALYVDTVRDELARAVGDIPTAFVTSSPSNGAQSDAEGYVAANPGSSLYGDVHVYDYVRDMWDPAIFPRPRFCSEYGLQSWPSLLALAAVSAPADWSLRSDFAAHRQHHAMGNAELLAEIAQHFRLPADVASAGGFADFVFLSQLNQAEAIRCETEHYRRGRSELTPAGEGRTMGAMFWQLNDIWQAPTWAAVEYGGRWKPLQYAARRFFAPLLVSAYVDGAGADRRAVAYVVSDLSDAVAGASLEAAVFAWDRFAPPATRRLLSNATVAAGAAQRVWAAPLAELLPEPDRQVARLALLDADGAPLAEPSYLVADAFRSVQLSIASVRVSEVSATRLDNRLRADRLRVRLAADAPAPFVWLETTLAGRFSDNGFHMLEPQAEVEFLAEEPTDAATLLGTLTVKSLQDAYQG